MTKTFISKGKDPDNPTRWILQCPTCGQERSVSNTTYYCHARKHQSSFCVRCGRAKHIEPSHDLIIKGIDQEHTGFWLIQCPDCQQIRSLSSVAKYRVVKSGDSRCRSCAAIKSRDPRRFNTDRILVIEPTDDSRKRWRVQCPDCGNVRDLGRSELSRLRKKGNSLCRNCAQIGERHHRWMDDPGLKRMYSRTEWHIVCKRILNRDRHTCQFPGCDRTESQDGRQLSIHHINPLRNCKEHDDDNLIAMCSEHHTWADQHLDESTPMLSSILCPAS